MQVNIWAVAVSAIASMVIGSIWYGPLFGKTYMSAVGMDSWSPEKKAEMKKGMVMSYVWQFIASIIMFYVLSMFMIGIGKTDLHGGLLTAFWVWIGFVVPLKFGDSLWGGKMTLFWLGIFNSLITLLIGAAILGVWR